MSDIFHSSKYTVERAKHHVSDFERQTREFLKSNPCTGVVEVDPNTSEQVHKIKLTKPMPVALPGIAFDAINNLRSALDQAGYAVSTGKRKSTAFPFADSQAQLDNVINRSCKDLPDEIVDLMRTFKPYKGGNDLLWALNKLCNTDKHTIISPVAVSSSNVTLNGVVKGPFMWPSIAWDRAKNEMVLCRIPPGGKVKAHFKYTTFIAMCDVEFVDGKPADAVLNAFVCIVEDIIMTIESEVHRLGL